MGLRRNKNDRLYTDSTPALTNLVEDGLTISGWVLVDTLGLTNDRLVDKADSTNASLGFSLAVDNNPSGIDLSYNRGHAVQEYGKQTLFGPMEFDQLHHFALRANDSFMGDQATLYVDGSEPNSSSTPGWGKRR